MTSASNRQELLGSRAGRVCASILLVLLVMPMTGCISNDLFQALFLSLACDGGLADPVLCDSLRLSVAEQQFEACHLKSCDSECAFRQQVIELYGEKCTDQQQQAQSAITPGGHQCTMDYTTQEALNDGIACKPRVNQTP